jgi:RNA polymerase sigma-70 factor (ECF subfamily)
LSRGQEQLSPEIILRIRERDPEALEIFFETYFDRAYGYVCRLLRDPEEAQDVTQVAFMKIHRAVHTLDPSRDPGSWVFAVVSNTVRDYWRSRRYKQSRRETSVDNAVLSSTVTAEDEQSARDTAQILSRALEELSEKLRAVVLLRDYEDLSYAEVAQVLGIAEAAARKRHSRALSELRRALDESTGPGMTKESRT